MSDPRIEKVAKLVTNYSINVKPGEKVLIHCSIDSVPMVKALIREIYAAGGYPFVNYVNEALSSEISAGTDKIHLENMARYNAYKHFDMDAVIYLNVPRNQHENSVISKEQGKRIFEWNKEINEKLGITRERPEVKPCVMTFPTNMTAYNARLSLEEYENIYYQACGADYPKMAVRLETLADMMTDTNEVHIVGIDTDLRFSLKGMKALVSAGDRNMPDGEAYCSPVKDSVNGKITYNLPSPYAGRTYENICLEFKDGRIINATSNYTKEINEVFDTDEGSRYIGEFAIDVNPYLIKPTGSILFDEKITGSIHFTPGNEIWKTGNGNKSAVHWDIVYSQLPEHGGGEIWFDGKLIRKDGLFVPEELLCLNPENLK